MDFSYIESLFKLKGSRMLLSNDRDIFILAALQKMLDKLLYLEKYSDLESNMSD